MNSVPLTCSSSIFLTSNNKLPIKQINSNSNNNHNNDRNNNNNNINNINYISYINNMESNLKINSVQNPDYLCSQFQANTCDIIFKDNTDQINKCKSMWNMCNKS
jgi:hypothetical protein